MIAAEDGKIHFSQTLFPFIRVIIVYIGSLKEDGKNKLKQ